MAHLFAFTTASVAFWMEMEWVARIILTLGVLSLSVHQAFRRRIFYMGKKLAGGYLDVDMNVHHDTTEPVENVFWDTCPPGKYTVSVMNWSYGGPDSVGKGKPIPCQVVLRTKVPVIVQNLTSKGSAFSLFPEKEKVIGLKAFDCAIDGAKLQRTEIFSFTVPPGLENSAETLATERVT